MSTPRYPHVRVALVGEDGNAFSILARVMACLRQAGVPTEEREAFRSEAVRGDYAHLLATVSRWVSTDEPAPGDDLLAAAAEAVDAYHAAAPAPESPQDVRWAEAMRRLAGTVAASRGEVQHG